MNYKINLKYIFQVLILFKTTQCSQEEEINKRFVKLEQDVSLILNENGLLRRKTHLIHKNEGIISNIKWCLDLIAWSNEKGIRIYNTAKKKK